MTITREPDGAWTWTPERLPAHLEQRGGDPALVGKELLSIIEDAIANQPRSLQKRIGPSEVGHPCARRLGYKLMGAPEFNPNQGVPWKPFIGTSVHDMLERVLDRWNVDHCPTIGHQERFLIETKVDVGDINGTPITGHSDVYDRVTATVVDWKVNGPAMLKGYKSKGPGTEYRSQAHLYGRGFNRMGLPVDNVMIIFLPRNDELHHAHVWHEPYNEQIAIDALTRAAAIDTASKSVGVDILQQLPTVDAYCHRCPFFAAGSTDLRHGCPGDPTANQPAQPALTLSR